MMSTVTVPTPAHINTPPAAPGPDHEPATPTPSQDDLPCGQRSHTTGSPAVQDDRSPIGSPFLTDREPSSVQAPSQLLSPIMLNMISSDTSVLNCDDSTGSNTCGDPQTIGAPAACCDHGRAIIDLRYTVDNMQFQIIELQSQLSNFSRGEPAVPAQARSGEIDVPTSPYNDILPGHPIVSCQIRPILILAWCWLMVHSAKSWVSPHQTSWVIRHSHVHSWVQRSVTGTACQHMVQ